VLDEGTVPAVRRDDRCDARIAPHCRIVKRSDRHKRIIRGGENECRHRDPIDHPHRTRPIVVVGRIVKAVMRGGVGFVELADRPDAT